MCDSIIWWTSPPPGSPWGSHRLFFNPSFFTRPWYGGGYFHFPKNDPRVFTSFKMTPGFSPSLKHTSGFSPSLKRTSRFSPSLKWPTGFPHTFTFYPFNLGIAWFYLTLIKIAPEQKIGSGWKPRLMGLIVLFSCVCFLKILRVAFIQVILTKRFREEGKEQKEHYPSFYENVVLNKCYLMCYFCYF